MKREFSHLDETGGISMVDVGAKRVTAREAVAAASPRRRAHQPPYGDDARAVG